MKDRDKPQRQGIAKAVNATRNDDQHRGKGKAKGKHTWAPSWKANPDGSLKFPSPFVGLGSIKEKFPKQKEEEHEEKV